MKSIMIMPDKQEFYRARSLKQQSVGRHIFLIPNEQIFTLTPKCCVLSGEAANTNFMIVGLNRPGLKPMIYPNPNEGANNYTTDVVIIIMNKSAFLGQLEVRIDFALREVFILI